MASTHSVKKGAPPMLTREEKEYILCNNRDCINVVGHTHSINLCTLCVRKECKQLFPNDGPHSKSECRLCTDRQCTMTEEKGAHAKNEHHCGRCGSWYHCDTRCKVENLQCGWCNTTDHNTRACKFICHFGGCRNRNRHLAHDVTARQQKYNKPRQEKSTKQLTETVDEQSVDKVVEKVNEPPQDLTQLSPWLALAYAKAKDPMGTKPVVQVRMPAKQQKEQPVVVLHCAWCETNGHTARQCKSVCHDQACDGMKLHKVHAKGDAVEFKKKPEVEVKAEPQA